MRWGLLLKWLAGAWLVGLATGAPAGLLADPRAVPGEAWIVLSVPDATAAWKALSATPVYKDTLALMASPVVGLPAWRELAAEQRQVEKEIGFALTGENLTALVAGFDVVWLAPRDSEASWACIFRVRDEARFPKIFASLQRRMARKGARGPEATSATVRRESSGDVEIVATETEPGLALARLSAQRFVLANRAAAIRLVIEQCRATEGLPESARFRQAIGGLDLQEKDPDAFLFVDASRLAPSLRQARLLGLPLASLTRAPTAFAAAFRIEPNAVRIESFLPYAEPDREALAERYRAHQPVRLQALDFISSAPLAFTARNTFDGLALYRSLRAVVLQTIPGMIPADQTAEENLDARESDFRRRMGFDLREDLAAAIGPEAFIELVDLRLDPLIPLPVAELVAGVQVRDREKMDRVMQGLEKSLGQVAAPGAPPARNSRGPVSENYRGQTIRSFVFPQAPIYSLAYARAGDFLLVGIGVQSIRGAIDRAQGRGKRFQAEATYASLRPYLHEECNEIFVLNIAKLAAMGREIVGRLAKGTPPQAEAARQAEQILRPLARIAAVGLSTAGDAHGLHTRGAIAFRPAPKKAPASRKR